MIDTVTKITAGEGISINAQTGHVIITNTMPNRNAFKFIEVTDQTTLEAKTHLDSFILESGNNITLATDPSSNKVIISVDSTITSDLVGDVTSNLVATSTLTITGDRTAVEIAYQKKLQDYKELTVQANDIRKQIIALQDQLIAWQEKKQEAEVILEVKSLQSQISIIEDRLLAVDKASSRATENLRLLEVSLSNTDASFSYDPLSMIVSSNRAISASLILQNVTTNQRNALIQVTNGRVIYNTTVDKLQAYAGGMWVNLH